MNWFDMGRHSVYVWCAYGTGVGFMIALTVVGLKRHRMLRHAIEAIWARGNVERK